MKRTDGGLLMRVACLVFLVAMALLAVPLQAQTVAYATNQSFDAISVVDTSNNSVTAFVGVGAAPFAVAITPDGRRA
jgi:YVTN family beta-propeller protein